MTNRTFKIRKRAALVMMMACPAYVTIVIARDVVAAFPKYIPITMVHNTLDDITVDLWYIIMFTRFMQPVPSDEDNAQI